MVLRSIFMNIYLRIINLILNIFNFIKSIFFKVTKIYTLNFDTNKQQNIYSKYILCKVFIICISFCSKIPLFGKYMDKIGSSFINIYDSKHDLMKIEIFINGVFKDIIYENVNIRDVIKKINKMVYDINDSIMNKKFIVTDIELDTNYKLSLKKLFDHYSDKSKKYDHSIKNILLLKNINHTENDLITIKYLQMLKYKEIKYKLGDVYNNHICDIYNLSI